MMFFAKPCDRNFRIGGTDAAVILGRSPWKVIDVLREEKLGRGEKFLGNKYTESGHLYEQAVANWYESETGETLMDPLVETDRGGIPGHVFVHKDHHFLVGSPDRLVKDKDKYFTEEFDGFEAVAVGGVSFGFEAKVAHFFSKKKWDGLAHKMPEEYYIQCQYYMMISGLDRWDLAVHHLGTADRDIHTIDADPFLHEEMLEKCVAFWEELGVIREREKKQDKGA